MRATGWTSGNWPRSQWETRPTARRDKGVILSTPRSLVNSRGDYAVSLIETQTTSPNSRRRSDFFLHFLSLQLLTIFLSSFHPTSSTTVHSPLSSTHPLTLHRQAQGCQGEGWKASNVMSQKNNISFKTKNSSDTQKPIQTSYCPIVHCIHHRRLHGL